MKYLSFEYFKDSNVMNFIIFFTSVLIYHIIRWKEAAV